MNGDLAIICAIGLSFLKPLAKYLSGSILVIKSNRHKLLSTINLLKLSPKINTTDLIINAYPNSLYAHRSLCICIPEKIKSKGYETVISARDNESTKYQVFVGSFSKRNDIESQQENLKASGFTPSTKMINNTYTLDLGTFLNHSDSNSLVRKLQDRGFKPKIKKVSVGHKIYTVRVEGLATENEAQKLSQKLARHGFKNSFIR